MLADAISTCSILWFCVDIQYSLYWWMEESTSSDVWISTGHHCNTFLNKHHASTNTTSDSHNTFLTECILHACEQFFETSWESLHTVLTPTHMTAPHSIATIITCFDCQKSWLLMISDYFLKHAEWSYIVYIVWIVHILQHCTNGVVL